MKLFTQENLRLRLFLLMLKYPEKDWRAIIRKIVAAPAKERASIFTEAFGALASEEERVMALMELQKIFGNSAGDYETT